MKKLKLIKDVKTLREARQSHKRSVNTMLHIIANNKNLLVSMFKPSEPIINEWLSEINKLNVKIADSSCQYSIQKKVA